MPRAVPEHMLPRLASGQRGSTTDRDCTNPSFTETLIGTAWQRNGTKEELTWHTYQPASLTTLPMISLTLSRFR